MDKRANDEPGSGGRTQRTAATQAQERSLMHQANSSSMLLQSRH